MMKKEIKCLRAPAAVGAYSQGIESSGFVFLSGQLPIDPENGTMPKEVEKQAEQSLKNVKNILESADKTLNDVIKTTIFLENIADFAAVNAVYQEFFEEPYPARSCFAVSALPKGAKVEVEVIAK